MSFFSRLVKKETAIKKIETIAGVGKDAAKELDAEVYGYEENDNNKQKSKNNDKKTIYYCIAMLCFYCKFAKLFTFLPI